MKRSFQEALENRRSYYRLWDKSPVSDKDIVNMLQTVARHVPSAFNSQSTRMVLLLGDHHRRLWDIVKTELKKIVPPESIKGTERKIDNGFRSGYGTVLFYEDRTTVARLQRENPLYSERFPTWSQQTSGMHQLAIWTMLEDMGFGASLQHYNPIIDSAVRKEWNISGTWELIAQMPFGSPAEDMLQKTFLPMEERIFTFGCQ
ncbi:MAG: nitroreductase family protein [Prevotella sp.]|nr:nitroreductase family protein [Prevotella sp.]